MPENPNARIDWRSITEAYAGTGEHQAAAVEAAKVQAQELQGTPEYWEAVHTLARQAIAMAADREVRP